MEAVNKGLAERDDSSWPSNRARALTKARDVGFFLGMTVSTRTSYTRVDSDSAESEDTRTQSMNLDEAHVCSCQALWLEEL